VERASLPDGLEIAAVVVHDEAHPEESEIMGLRHKSLPVESVQFHPESFLTTVGKDLLRNFLTYGGRP
jgi:para-aminobenzoate synthetase component 2